MHSTHLIAAILLLTAPPLSGDTPPPPSPAEAATRLEGVLDATDRRTPSGAYVDDHVMELQAGQLLTASLTSRGFRPHLRVRAPSGTVFESGSDAPNVELWAAESGTWTVEVASADPGGTGTYRLDVRRAGEALGPPGWPARFVEVGWLGEPEDDVLDSGEFVDVFVFDGHSGDEVELDVRAEFAPFLALIAPGGEMVRTEEREVEGRRARLWTRLPEVGAYTIAVTSDVPEVTGAYTVHIQVHRPSASGRLIVSD